MLLLLSSIISSNFLQIFKLFKKIIVTIFLLICEAMACKEVKKAKNSFNYYMIIIQQILSKYNSEK